MPDKKTKVTDPTLLAQLNGEATTSTPILQQVEESFGDLPEDKKGLLLAQVRHETGRKDLQSNVAIQNNNVSGITWNENFPDEWKGTSRPSREGGNYVKFPTISDWSKAYRDTVSKNKGYGSPLDATTIEGFAHRLKKNGYYTAGEKEYLAGLKKMSDIRKEKATDPSILAQLNDETPISQKKSPLGSESGSATSSSVPQNGLQNIDNGQQITTTPSPAPLKPITIEPQIESGLSGVDNITHIPVNNPEPVNEKAQTTQKVSDATQYLSQDIITNTENHHPDIQTNLGSIPFHEPGSIVHDVTNPHGDPATTGTYTKDRLTQLEAEKNQKINEAGFNDPSKAAGANPQILADINRDYEQKANKLKESASTIVGLQLFNKDYQDKKYTGEEALTAKDAAEREKEEAIKAANTHLHDKIQGEDKYDIDRANKEFHAEVQNINSSYNRQLSDIQNHTKWDDVRLGLEHDKLMGDPQAEADLDRYNSGKSIYPEAKLKYQLTGQQILKSGNSSTVNENVAKESEQHIKTPEQIEGENQELFNRRRAEHIGASLTRDVNPIYRAIFPLVSLAVDENSSIYRALVPRIQPISKEAIKAKGKELGYTDAQLDKIDPKDIPTEATAWQHFAKGALNTAAPIYEQGVRMAGRVAGVNTEDINEAFPAGWENQRGPGAAMVGNAPSSSNGLLDQTMEGLGALALLPAEIGGVAKAAEALSLAKTASGAHALANFGVMAFNGYNNAYHESGEVLGDKPADEWKRQLYAAGMGAIEGAIFSITPQANPGALIERAIGLKGAEKEGALIGNDFLKELKTAKDPFFIQSPSGLKTIANVVKEAAKDNGIQIGLATANEIAKSTVNTMLNPKKQSNLPEDLKNNAISTAFTMLIPSIMAGINHVSMQTPIAKDAMFDIGAHPQKYVQEISNQLAAKDITPQQAQQSHEAILTMKGVIDNTPVVNSAGRPLTPDQIKDYSWSLLREHTLQQQADQIAEKATQSGIVADKAQIEPLNKQIAEQQSERKKILSEKAPARIPTPLPEKPIEEPAAERSVAPEDEKSEPAEKKEEKKVNENEKDITLPSQEKTNEDEISTHDQEGRKGNTQANEGEELGQDTNLREAADSNNRHVKEENRVLSEPRGEPVKEEAKPQEEKTPVASAIEESKPKKNRFAKIEEKEPVKPEPDAVIPSERQVEEVYQPSGEQEHAPVEPVRGEAEAASPESSDSHIGGKAEEEIIKVADDINVAPKEETQEKPIEVPEAERSVATNPEESKPADQQKSPLTTATESFNKYNDAVSKKEAALEKLREQGKEKGDIDFDKKAAELHQAKAKKVEAFKAMDIETRKEETRNAHSLSKNIRKSTKKIAEELTKTRIEGSKAGAGISKEAIEWIGNRIADLVELGENLHLAIRKAINERKQTEKIGKEQEKEIKTQFQEGPHAEKYRDNLRHEPPILENKEDYDLSVDLVKDIKARRDTFEDVMDDLHEANINPERKRAIADFIDREVNLTNHQREQAKETYNNQTLREPSHENTYLTSYELSGSGETSKYISGETLEDVFGEEVQFDINSKETQLQKNIIKDTANMVGLAKNHAGSDDILVYGTKMLGDIKALPVSDAVKKVLAISGLNNELHGEKIRLENEALTATDERKNEIQNRIKDIKKMIAQAELVYRDTTSNASNVLNAARANRIYRNTYFADEHAMRILSDEQRKAKDKIESALEDTKIPDKVAETIIEKPKEQAEKEVKQIIEEKNKSEAGKNVESDLPKKDKEKPTDKEKSKNFVKRIKEKSKPSEESSIRDLAKNAESKMGGKTPEEFLNNLKEKIKKKKC